MNYEESVEYAQESGWIKPLDELSLEELFELQSQVGKAIEKEVKRKKL